MTRKEIEDFFKEYEETFNRAMAEPLEIDMEKQVEYYTTKGLLKEHGLI